MAEIIVKLAGRICERVIVSNTTRIQIGRTPDNNIVLDNVGVSRHHATIEFRSGKSYIVDNQSLNGTFLNGHRVYEAELNDGDVLDIGKFILHYCEATTSSTASEGLQGTMMMETRKQRNLLLHNQPESETSPEQCAYELIVDGDSAKGEYLLDRPRLTLGSSASADIRISGWFVAGLQAHILWEQGNHYLENTGHFKRTKLNRHRLKGRTKLTVGDLIQIGHNKFQYVRCA
jgi:pSer/pThr/pTyr-binding forkhead associated (FHA) protein